MSYFYKPATWNPHCRNDIFLNFFFIQVMHRWLACVTLWEVVLWTKMMAFHLHSYWLMKWPTCKKNYVLLSLRRASCVLLSISRNILILYKGLIFEKVLIFKLRVLYSIKGILQSITEWVCTMMDFLMIVTLILMTARSWHRWFKLHIINTTGQDAVENPWPDISSSYLKRSCQLM